MSLGCNQVDKASVEALSQCDTFIHKLTPRIRLRDWEHMPRIPVKTAQYSSSSDYKSYKTCEVTNEFQLNDSGTRSINGRLRLLTNYEP